MGQNKLVQVGAACLLMVIFLVTAKACKDDSASEEGTIQVGGGDALSEEALAGLGIEGDTERDVVATLIGEVRDMKGTMNQLRQDNAALRQDNDHLRDMEQNIGERMESQLESASSQAGEAAQAQAEQLIRRLEVAEQRLKRASQAGARQDSARALALELDSPDTVWVQPLGVSADAEGGSGGTFLDSLENAGSEASRRIGVERLPGARTVSAREKPMIPYYTIPRNATLVSSTAMTALVGRVPFGGQVTDPYSFKVIIGRDNLMANGVELPEVSYAIASGRAVGDWTLSCVRGDLYSLTFVFEDGTIRTVPKAKDIYEGNATQQEIKIGELSDRYGNPCVMGQRITNAVEYLSQRMGVVSVQAAAEAAAASQTTQITSVDSGGTGITTVVDGSTGEYILGRSIADGANEVARWLDERQAQQFDAVYVAPGADVSMHITEQIDIDYDPNGRKTNHAAFLTGGYRELD